MRERVNLAECSSTLAPSRIGSVTRRHSFRVRWHGQRYLVDLKRWGAEPEGNTGSEQARKMGNAEGRK